MTDQIQDDDGSIRFKILPIDYNDESPYDYQQNGINDVTLKQQTENYQKSNEYKTLKKREKKIKHDEDYWMTMFGYIAIGCMFCMIMYMILVVKDWRLVLSITFWFHVVFLPMIIFYHRRNIALQKRGQKGIAKILVTYPRIACGMSDSNLTYQFTFDSVQHDITATLPKSKWNFVHANDDIEVIFDPQNPKLYNIPFSQLSQNDAEAKNLIRVVFIFNFIFGFAVGVFLLFSWYQIIINTFIIPIAVWIVIDGLLYLYLNCGKTNHKETYESIHGEEELGIDV